MSSELEQFEPWLHERVTAAVNGGVTSLTEIVRACRGADPAVVQNAIEACGLRGKVEPPPRSQTGIADVGVAIRPGLTPPHPLDYEWRFSRSGAETLLRHAGCSAGGDLLLLGCTTIGLIAHEQKWHGPVRAIDRSPVVSDLITSLGLPVGVRRMDLTVAAPAPSIADVVLIDPPWYVQHAEAFLRSATVSCRVGGRVLAILPGSGTRPGADADCSRLVARCEMQGLRLERMVPDGIEYETPYFEHNALRAAGVPGDHPGWRRGDLYEFARRDVPVPPKSSGHAGAPRWHEFRTGPIRVRFRPGGARTGNTALQTLVEGDILPTVSRRDRRRDLVEVWTCGNRVFGCEDAHSLFLALIATAQGSDPVAATETSLGRSLGRRERDLLGESCSRLREIVELEHDEWNRISAGEESDVVGQP